MKKIVLGSNLLVPAELVPLNALSDFKVDIKDKEGEVQNYDFFSYDDEHDAYRFARGDLDLLAKHFDPNTWEDKRSAPEMKIDLQFTGTLRPNQQKVADAILADGRGFGQLNAPPRFGKTITMCYLTCKIGLKTVFLSHQIDLAKQALKAFYKFTNIADLEYIAGKQLIGIATKWKHIDEYDICFLPYQKFMNRDKLQKHKDDFGVVWIDESHRSSPERYSEVVSTFNPRWRMGVSGTTERKDNMHLINNFTLGPVLYRGEAEQVPCSALMINTGITVPYRAMGKSFFGIMLNYLSEHDHRNKNIILPMMASYLKAGHYCIAVTDRISQADSLVKELKTLGYKAEAFHRKRFGSRKKPREECLERCRTGETQILICYRTMTLGLDIPRLTAFFNLLPTANMPNYYQEFCRVRTPFENKNLSHIVDFVDNHHRATSCAKSRVKKYQEEGFEVSYHGV